MEEQIKSLNQQLLQRDETINVMKVRTKDYVQKINEDHAAALRKLEAALSTASEESAASLATVSLKDAEVQRLKDALESAEADRQRMDADVTSLKDALAARDIKFEAIEKAQSASGESNTEMNNAFHALQIENDKLKAELQNLEQQKTSLAAELETIQRAHEEGLLHANQAEKASAVELAELRIKLNQLEQENVLITTNCAEQTALVSKYQEEAKASSPVRSKPADEQRLEAYAAQLAEKYQELSDVTARLEQRDKVIAELQTMVETHQGTVAMLEAREAQQVAELMAKLKQSEEEFAVKLKAESKKMEALLVESEEKVTSLHEKVTSLESLAQQYQAENAELNDKLAALEPQLAQSRELIDKKNDEVLALQADISAALIINANTPITSTADEEVIADLKKKVEELAAQLTAKTEELATAERTASELHESLGSSSSAAQQESAELKEKLI
eukprot:gene17073-19463_t